MPGRRRGGINERHVHGTAYSGPVQIWELAGDAARRRCHDRKTTQDPKNTPGVSQCFETGVTVGP